MKRLRRPLSLSTTLLALLVLGGTLLAGSTAVRADAGSRVALAGTVSFESDTGLYSTDLTSGQVRRIPGTGAGYGDPVWSPDGTRLLFDRQQDLARGLDWNEPRDVYVMNADGSGLRQLTFNPGDDGWAKWSPDGRSIVFSSERYHRSGIYAMNVRTGAARYVVDGEYPSWRIDGRILFTSAGQILTVRPYGAQRRPLRTRTYDVIGAVPSPDGTKIAYITDDFELYSARADGSDARALAGELTGDANDPAWSPDGEWVVYDYPNALERASDIYLIHPDGTSNQRVTRTGNASCPDWRTEPV